MYLSNPLGQGPNPPRDPGTRASDKIETGVSSRFVMSLFYSLFYSLWLCSAAFAGELQGSVTEFGTSLPLPEVLVVIEDLEGHEVHRVQTGPGGRFSVELPEGEYRIVLLGQVHRPHEDQVKVGESGRVRVRYALRDASYEFVVTEDRERTEVERQVVTVEELTAMPGSFGDPVLALQAFPSVSRGNFLDQNLVVRGAEGINTGFYVDEMPVPYMFHNLVGRSIINPVFVEDIEFFAGGMPSRFGDVTQAVVNIRADRDSPPGHAGRVSVDLLDGSIAYRQSWQNGLTVRIAGRYAWVGVFTGLGTAIAVKRAGGELDEATYFFPRYWDAYGDLVWEPKHLDDRVSLTFLGARDALIIQQPEPDTDGDGEPGPPDADEPDLPYDPGRVIDNGFGRVRLRWDRTRGPRTSSSWIATGPQMEQNLLGSLLLSADGPFLGRTTGWSTVIRHDDRWKKSENYALVDGAQLIITPVRAEDFSRAYEEGNPIPTTEDVQVSAAAWVEAQYRHGPWWFGTGLRLAYTQWEGHSELGPEPRLSMRRSFGEDWTLKAFVGRFTQMPPITRYAEGLGNPDIPLLTAWQFSVGAEGRLPGGWSLDTSVYETEMRNLVYQDSEVEILVNEDYAEDVVTPVYIDAWGRAVGLEILLRRKQGSQPLWGWMALTLGRSLRMDGERVFPGDNDAPIDFTLLVAADLPRRITASARLRLGSGHPFTPSRGVYNPATVWYESYTGSLNSDRYPFYRQLDIRVEKTWTGRRLDWSLYLDVYNATWAENPVAAFYSYDYSELTTFIHVPIIPTLGATCRF